MQKKTNKFIFNSIFRWDNAFKKQGSKRSIKNTETKQEVVDYMKDFMDDKVGSIKIHKKDGKYQEERTYQRKDDPTSSKG